MNGFSDGVTTRVSTCKTFLLSREVCEILMNMAQHYHREATEIWTLQVVKTFCIPEADVIFSTVEEMYM